METREYRTIDKSSWDRGPWDDEPDKIQWQDEATGLPCLAVRHPSSGHWCGYVGVAEGHPCFSVEYDSCKPVAPLDADSSEWLEVHGGLTFSDFCQETEHEGEHICHVPGPGEPDRVWWLGFDCAHSGDLSPGRLHRDREIGILRGSDFESYKDLGYVKCEVRRLARQLVSPEMREDV